MHKQLRPFSQTPSFSKLILDYLEGDEKLKNFYSHQVSIEAFEGLIKNKQKPIDRALLVDILKSQNRHSNSKVIANIQLLEKETTFTVTTGHQLCICGGPLYFIYKTISTLKLAKKLKESYPDYDFVPLFWLASEDHGKSEINTINIYGKQLKWDINNSAPSGGYRTDGIQEVIHEIESLIGNEPFGSELIQLFREAYHKNNNLSKATRHLLDGLFGEYGLVVLDPQHKELKRHFTSCMQTELIDELVFKSVQKTNESLSKEYKIQASPRDINLFYCTSDFRSRIVKNGKGTYEVVDQGLTFTKNQLLDELRANPENFSPNVLMRPLYQEFILPNLAYIGGPGEVAYWMELKAMFNAFNIDYPIVVLRDSVMLASADIQSKMEKIGLQIDDFFLGEDEFTKLIMSKTSTPVDLSKEKTEVLQHFENLKTQVLKRDSSLFKMLEGERSRLENSLLNIEKKLYRADKQQNETVIRQALKIKQTLFPNGKLQERHDSFITWYAKEGGEFIDTLLEQLNPLDKQFKVLLEES